MVDQRSRHDVSAAHRPNFVNGQYSAAPLSSPPARHTVARAAHIHVYLAAVSSLCTNYSFLIFGLHFSHSLGLSWLFAVGFFSSPSKHELFMFSACLASCYEQQ